MLSESKSVLTDALDGKMSSNHPTSAEPQRSRKWPPPVDKNSQQEAGWRRRQGELVVEDPRFSRKSDPFFLKRPDLPALGLKVKAAP